MRVVLAVKPWVAVLCLFGVLYVGWYYTKCLCEWDGMGWDRTGMRIVMLGFWLLLFSKSSWLQELAYRASL